MADLATLKARKAALEEAEFTLLSGQTEVKISYDGGSVEYRNNPQQLMEIRSLIFKLESQIRSHEGRGGPIQPMVR